MNGKETACLYAWCFLRRVMQKKRKICGQLSDHMIHAYGGDTLCSALYVVTNLNELMLIKCHLMLHFNLEDSIVPYYG